MSLILKMGFANLFRHRRRSILTGSAILLAVAITTFVQCYLRGLIDTMVYDFIRLQTGHVRLLHPDYQLKERLFPLNLNVDEVEQRIEDLKKIPAVKQVAPRIRFGTLLSFGQTNQTGLGIGIVPQLETEIMRIEGDIRDGGSLKPGGMVIGAILAEKLGVKLGDEVTVLGQTQYHSIAAGLFEISGILTTGFEYIDRSTFFINFDEAQEMLDMENRASELVVMGKAKEDVAGLLSALKQLSEPNDLTALSWLEQGGMGQMLRSTNASIVLLLGIVLFLAGLTITNTMLMSVLERTREIGTLKAIGMRPLRIVALFLCEGFYLGLLGSLGGTILGSAFALVLERTGIHIEGTLKNFSLPMAEVLYPHFYWEAPLLALTFGTIVAMLASLVPAYKASRMLPREAML